MPDERHRGDSNSTNNDAQPPALKCEHDNQRQHNVETEQPSPGKLHVFEDGDMVPKWQREVDHEGSGESSPQEQRLPNLFTGPPACDPKRHNENHNFPKRNYRNNPIEAIVVFVGGDGEQEVFERAYARQ